MWRPISIVVAPRHFAMPLRFARFEPRRGDNRQSGAVVCERRVPINLTGYAVDSTDHNGRDRTLGGPQSYFNENLVLLRLRRSQSPRPIGMVQHLVDG